jgi:hypothetical protein
MSGINNSRQRWDDAQRDGSVLSMPDEVGFDLRRSGRADRVPVELFECNPNEPSSLTVREIF